MTAIGARLGFWVALTLIGAAAGGWLMWGQVQDARTRALAAEEQAVELGKRLEEISMRQAQTDASLAARRLQSGDLTSQLFRLRSDLNRMIRDDPASTKWASDCVPGAIADRMRLPADPRCIPAGIPAR